MEPTNQDENHQRITIEQYNKEIDDAVKRVESGQFYTHDEAVEILNKPARKKFILQYNQELSEAEKRMDSGLFISQEDLEKEAESW